LLREWLQDCWSSHTNSLPTLLPNHPSDSASAAQHPPFCRWVPLLFAVAGVLIGVGVPILDVLTLEEVSRATVPATVPDGASMSPQQRAGGAPAPAPPPRHTPQPPAGMAAAGNCVRPHAELAPPSWPAVLCCVGAFVMQYALSGELASSSADAAAAAAGEALTSDPTGVAGLLLPQWLTVDATLAAYAAGVFLIFDGGTAAGGWDQCNWWELVGMRRPCAFDAQTCKGAAAACTE
jgi:hypothetical protein